MHSGTLHLITRCRELCCLITAANYPCVQQQSSGDHDKRGAVMWGDVLSEFLHCFFFVLQFHPISGLPGLRRDWMPKSSSHLNTPQHTSAYTIWCAITSKLAFVFTSHRHSGFLVRWAETILMKSAVKDVSLKKKWQVLTICQPSWFLIVSINKISLHSVSTDGGLCVQFLNSWNCPMKPVINI